LPCCCQTYRPFVKCAIGLAATVLSKSEMEGIMGDNWLRFYDVSFGPQT